MPVLLSRFFSFAWAFAWRGFSMILALVLVMNIIAILLEQTWYWRILQHRFDLDSRYVLDSHLFRILNTGSSQPVVVGDDLFMGLS